MLSAGSLENRAPGFTRPAQTHGYIAARDMATPRTPASFRERVLREFRSAANVRHLADAFRHAVGDPRTSRAAAGRIDYLLRSLPETVDRFAAASGGELIGSDPLAARGSASRSSNIVEELQHLNRAFFHARMRAAQTFVGPSGAPQAPVDNEPLFYRMFAADSLRPPGLEGLNGPGPSHAALEDQAAVAAMGGRAPRSCPPPFYKNAAPPEGVSDALWNAAAFDDYDPTRPADDYAWGRGDPSRSAEDAVSEYYGNDNPLHNAMGAADPRLWAAERDVRVGNVPKNAPGAAAAARRPPTDAKCGWGDLFEDPTNGDSIDSIIASVDNQSGYAYPASASRYQRRPGIPFWQKQGRRVQAVFGRWQSVDPDASPQMAGGDLDETLGSGSAEFGGEREAHVRGWDMDRLREPRGESYMQLGPRHNGR